MSGSINNAIVQLYDVESVDIDSIAEGMNITREQVELALAQGSKKYRKDCKKDPSLFSDKTLQLAAEIMESCLYAENPDGSPDYSTRVRASKFIINEKKGRHDLRNIQNVNINVSSVNEQMANALKALEEAKNNIIDIPSDAQRLLAS